MSLFGSNFFSGFRFAWYRLFFTRLFGFLTCSVREVVVVDWDSNSVFYKFFRAFEFLFGRKCGIRPEVSSFIDNNGRAVFVFHTLEAALVHGEMLFREWLKRFSLVKIPIPIPQPSLVFGGFPRSVTSQPYLFAIAYEGRDFSTFGSGSTTKSWSTGITGSNRLMIAFGYAENGETVSSFTCASVEMTSFKSEAMVYSPAHTLYGYYLCAPAPGTQTVSFTTNGTANKFAAFLQYSGAAQSNPIDGFGAGHSSSSSSSQTASVTTSASDSWLCAACWLDNGGTLSGKNETSTKRGSYSALVLVDSDGVVSPGAHTIGAQTTVAGNTVLIGCGIKIAASFSVSTAAVSDVATTSAVLNGEIVDAGGDNADARGFVYGTSSHGDPGNVAPASSSYALYSSESGSFAVGTFDFSASGLSDNQTYYVRAWAHYAGGYVYGDEVEFTTDAIVYAIAGTVTLNGSPVSGAVVRCVRLSDNVAVASDTTDLSGQYLISALDVSDRYHLCVEYEDEAKKYYTYSYWGIVPFATN